jgi:hypothetical protein
MEDNWTIDKRIDGSFLLTSTTKSINMIMHEAIFEQQSFSIYNSAHASMDTNTPETIQKGQENEPERGNI